MGDLSSHHDLEEARARLGLFASILSVFLAVEFTVARLGFVPDLSWSVLQTVGVCWFLIHFPFCLRWLIKKKRDLANDSWLCSDGLLSISALLVVALFGLLSSACGFALGSLIAALGFGLGLLHWCKHRPAMSIASLGGLLGLSLFVGLYLAGMCWGQGYQNPLFVPALAFGHGNIDTLFHASVANMIRTYGVPSTGLDGIPFIPYHFGSHWIFAQIANLLNLSVIDVYQLVYPVALLPFGIHSLLLFSLNLPKFSAGQLPLPIPSKNRLGWRYWGLFCVGYLGFLPLSVLDRMPALGYSVFLSESYNLALAVSLHVLSAGMLFLNRISNGSSAQHRTDILLATIIIPVLLAGIGLLKISLMCLLMVAVLYAFLRLQFYKSPLMWVFVGVCVLCCGIAFQYCYSPQYQSEMKFLFFGFMRWNVEPSWWAYFLPLYYAWVVGYLWYRLCGMNVRTVSDLGLVLRQRQAVDIELLLFISFIGALPGMVLTNYSSTHYFSDFQRWLALGMLLGTFGIQVTKPQKSKSTSCRELPLKRLLVFAVGLLVAGTLLINTGLLGSRFVSKNLAARGFPHGGSGLGRALMRGDFKQAGQILSEQADAVNSRLKNQKPILVELRKLDKLPLSEKQETLLYIPKSNRVYWDLIAGPNSPYEVPLIAPALSGIAMLDGLNEPAQSPRKIGYGYATYPSDSDRLNLPNMLSDNELCERAQQKGFSRLLVIQSDSQGTIQIRKVECP